MKLLVFAHTPPPHHGQSYMVQSMLDGFGGDHRLNARPAQPNPFGIQCYHVNARLSTNLQNIGRFNPRKILLLAGYCAQAVWCRLRYGINNFYYIPAPGKRAALLRDWLVLLLCRPFFKRIIFHWHAAGLTEWLENSSSATRWVTRSLLGRSDLSIVLSRHNMADGTKLAARRIRIVHNGIVDPCPGFESELLPRRLARLAALQKLAAGQTFAPAERELAGTNPHLIKLLYLAHCSHEKGLFDALEALSLANRKLASSKASLRLQLTVAGEFVEAAERREFENRVAEPDLQISATEQRGINLHPSSENVRQEPAVRYVGFISGAEKHRALAESDCLCFPTYYHAESFGLVLIEAMALGLPIVATRWRSIPELFPPEYPGLVEIRSPAGIGEAINRVVFQPTSQGLRDLFVQNFSLPRHLTNLAEALISVERAAT